MQRPLCVPSPRCRSPGGSSSPAQMLSSATPTAEEEEAAASRARPAAAELPRPPRHILQVEGARPPTEAAAEPQQQLQQPRRPRRRELPRASRSRAEPRLALCTDANSHRVVVVVPFANPRRNSFNVSIPQRRRREPKAAAAAAAAQSRIHIMSMIAPPRESEHVFMTWVHGPRPYIFRFHIPRSKRPLRPLHCVQVCNFA